MYSLDCRRFRRGFDYREFLRARADDPFSQARLVFHDLLGIREGLGARFVKRYANLLDEMVDGVSAFAEDVRGRSFPAPEHGYTIDADELTAFRSER